MARLRDLTLFSDGNLVSYYELDSGALTTDSKGTNTLTNNNVVGEGTALYGTSSADFGSANTNKSLTRTDGLGVGLTGGFSWSGWVKMRAVPTNGGDMFTIVDWRSTTGTDSYVNLAYRQSGATVNFYYEVGDGVATTSYDLGTSNWFHIAFTDTGTSWKLYVNGLQINSTLAHGANNPGTIDKTNLGVKTDSSNYASMYLDDVAFFSRELTVDEVLAIVASTSPSISPSASQSLSPSGSASPSGSQSPSASTSASASKSQSPSASTSASASKSLSPSSSPSSSMSRSISPSPSASGSASPSVPASLYTRQALAALPTTKNDLAITYSAQEIIDVSEDDGVRVEIEGTPPDYLVHQYKITHSNSHDTLNIQVDCQSTVAPSTTPVYLQIWNVHTSSWETIATDSTSDADIDFLLTGIISTSLSHYYDDRADLLTGAIYDTNEITIRVYQYNLV